MMPRPHSSTAIRLPLPQVTLCAVTSVNVQATVEALRACLDQVAFGACKLLTDVAIQPDHPEIRVVPIARIESAAAYSRFMLSNLADHVQTSHCLVTQWDGHILDARHWRPEFLDYDYIGARWPQFDDCHTVGNGGFSLRSRRLMEACRDPDFHRSHPEDLAIGRINRDWLEAKEMRFAPSALADLFATERAGVLKTSFGYHGVFNMPDAIGIDAFWARYRELDERGTVWIDLQTLLGALLRGPQPIRRIARVLSDKAADRLNFRRSAMKTTGVA